MFDWFGEVIEGFELYCFDCVVVVGMCSEDDYWWYFCEVFVYGSEYGEVVYVGYVVVEEDGIEVVLCYCF